MYMYRDPVLCKLLCRGYAGGGYAAADRCPADRAAQMLRCWAWYRVIFSQRQMYVIVWVASDTENLVDWQTKLPHSPPSCGSIFAHTQPWVMDGDLYV
eukprot:COSAG02_NODE_560_length_20328_cov_15.507343_10_plen_98_part_00